MTIESLSPGFPLVQRLAWMLIHSVWEGTALAALLGLVLVPAGKIRGAGGSNLRYGLACGAMLAFAVCALVTFVLSGKPAAITTYSPQMVAFASPISNVPSSAGGNIPAVALARPPFDWHRLMPIMVVLWFSGVVLQALWQCVGWVRVQRLRHGRPIEDRAWADTARQIAQRLGIRRLVRLICAGRIDVPAVIGILRPVIIVPVALLNDLPIEHAQAILAHELAHIRRHDYAVNLIQTAVETLFFYHPAVWWISRQIRRERENCCDDIAAEICGSRANYARALVGLEECRVRPPRLAPAATGGALVDRVRRLLGVPAPRGGRARSMLAAAVTLLCALSPISCDKHSGTAAPAASATPPTTCDGRNVNAVTDSYLSSLLAEHEKLTAESEIHAFQPKHSPPDDPINFQMRLHYIDSEIAKARHQEPENYRTVRVVVGFNGFISIDGVAGSWQTMRDQLGKLPAPNRANVIIALVAEGDDLPESEFVPAQDQASRLVKDLGLAYVSFQGIDKLGTTRPSTRAQRVVYIGGDIKRSGVYGFSEGMTLRRIIIAAGGIASADWPRTRITLIRRSKDGGEQQVIEKAPYAELMNGQAADVPLEPNDLVYVNIGRSPSASNPATEPAN